MKLSIKFLTLFLITTTFSHSIIINNRNHKRLDVDIDLTEIANCVSSLNEIKECQISKELFKNDRDTACASYDIKSCEIKLNEGIKNNEECKYIPEEIFEASPVILEIILSRIELACSKDEEGNYCPLSEINFVKTSSLVKEDIINSLVSTCKSTKCTEVALNTLKEIKTSEKITNKVGININSYKMDMEKINMIEEYLESDKCTVKINNSKSIKSNDSNLASDDANSIKMNPLLIFMLNLLLYILI